MITKNISVQQEFFGETTIILAKRGYGKSYTARVIVEEGLKLGVPFIIIDPQDAYLNLKEFAYIDATQVKSVRTLAIVLSASHKNTVIQMKRLSIDDQNKFLKVFLDEYKKNITKGIQTIVIDEMHKYAPESEKTEAKDVVRGMYQENRSDGLGIIGISQRVSRIDKTCLSQADHLCIGKVTSFRDKEAIKNYIDDPEDIEKIKRLNKGQFYFYGFGLSDPVVEQVRKANSEHSGGSPQHLLTEDSKLFQQNVNKFYTEKKKMSEEIPQGTGINKIIPTTQGFKHLAILGAKMSLGVAASGLVGTFVGSKFKSPVPVVSSRTLGSVASTVVLYTSYRMLPEMHGLKDVAKYATAGATVFTVGSLTFDLLSASKIQVPNIVSFLVATATGASPMAASNQKSESGSSVDLNTAMA